MNRLPHDWFDADLPAGIEIGAGSWLYSSFAFIHCRASAAGSDPFVRIGRDCGIYNGSFFELGAGAVLRIGDFTTLVGAIIASRRAVLIGSYCFIAHEVVIADTPFAMPPDVAVSVAPGAGINIGDDVWIGAGATLVGNLRIGDGAVVAAAAVVDADVPPQSIVAGNPARVVGSTRSVKR